MVTPQALSVKITTVNGNAQAVSVETMVISDTFAVEITTVHYR